MPCLMTGLCFQKCVLRWFHCCMNIGVCLRKPRWSSVVHIWAVWYSLCSQAMSLHSMLLCKQPERKSRDAMETKHKAAAGTTCTLCYRRLSLIKRECIQIKNKKCSTVNTWTGNVFVYCHHQYDVLYMTVCVILLYDWQCRKSVSATVTTNK